jgi:hypothetical protein
VETTTFSSEATVIPVDHEDVMIDVEADIAMIEAYANGGITEVWLGNAAIIGTDPSEPTAPEIGFGEAPTPGITLFNSSIPPK